MEPRKDLTTAGLEREVAKLKEEREFKHKLALHNEKEFVKVVKKLKEIKSLEYNFRNPDISFNEFIKRLKEIVDSQEKPEHLGGWTR